MFYDLLYRPRKSRFEFEVEDHVYAYIYFRKSEDRFELFFTFVPEEFRGKGIGEDLVLKTLDLIKKSGWQEFATCPFIQAIKSKVAKSRPRRINRQFQSV